MEVEEPAERAGELQRPRRVRRDPVERRAEIVELRLERVRPARLRLEPAGVRGLGEVDEVRGVPFTEVRLLVALGEAVRARTRGSSRASRTALRSGATGCDRRASRAARARLAANRLGGVEREPAGEDREPREEPARFVVEEIDAPLDRRAQRALALGDVARAARQQRQSLLEPREDRGRRQDGRLRRGELDRQRQAVEPAAELRDLGRCRGCARARRTARRRRRREAAALRRRAPCVRRSGARLVASTTTSGPASRTPATCGDASGRCSRLSRTRSMRRAPSSRARLWPLSSFTPSAPAIIDGTRSESLTAARPTKNAPSGKSGASSSGDAEREARLAGAAWTGQRDEPRSLANEPNERGDFIRPADQRRRGTRQVRRRAFPIAAARSCPRARRRRPGRGAAARRDP